jgi:hypothetical protein
LELFEPWRNRDSTSAEDALGLDLTSTRLFPSIPPVVGKDRLLLKRLQVTDDDRGPLSTSPPAGSASKPRSGSTVLSASISKQAESSRQLSPPATPTKILVSSRDEASDPTLAFSFTHILNPVDGFFSSLFASPLPVRTSQKRARPAADVDGPYTADLSSKKRRLRLRLFTSRLSQPFSVPAAHILSREAAVSGEKRFVKLASYIDPSRRIPDTECSALRRAAVLNRVRLRACQEAAERGNRALAVVAANAAMLHHSPHQTTGARFIVSQASPEKVVLEPSPKTGAGVSDGVHHIGRHRPGLSPPTTPKMKALESKDGRLPPSPRLRPLSSPELGPHRFSEGEMDEVDDEEVAFPTAEHESRYESSDDPEEVYSDFSLIFGGPPDAFDDEDEYPFEEYLEDLDGIPCAVR